MGISYDNSFLLAFGGDTVYHIPYVEHGGTGNESVSYVGTVVSLVGIAADFSGIVRGFYTFSACFCAMMPVWICITSSARLSLTSCSIWPSILAATVFSSAE